MTPPPAHRDNRLLAMACILAGVAFASLQDAIVKGMANSVPAYETVMLRCIGSVPVLALLVWRMGLAGSLDAPLKARIVLRGVILGLAYLCFVLAMAAMPIADAVAIYFTMPFFVAGLAGPMLGERVRPHRWIAIAVGFLGVLLVVRPGVAVFEPASLLPLGSALGYAVGQMIGRPIAHRVNPVVIAVWQNAIYFAIGLVLAIVFNVLVSAHFSHPSLVFLARPWVWPGAADTALMLLMGVLAALAMVLFVNAYKFAETNYVAPFEYSAMIWAVINGLVFFGDFPDRYTSAGAAIVIAAGLAMVWRDRVLDRAA